MSSGLWDRSLIPGDQDQYPALRSLTENKRAFISFMNGYMAPQPRLASRWQSDPLHRALRTTTALETLIVVPEEKATLSAAPPGIVEKYTLNALRTLTLPPPSVWALDVITPNVEVLKSVLPSEIPHVNDIFLSQHIRPLVPRHSPFTCTAGHALEIDTRRVPMSTKTISSAWSHGSRTFQKSRPWPFVVSGDLTPRSLQAKVRTIASKRRFLNPSFDIQNGSTSGRAPPRRVLYA